MFELNEAIKRFLHMPKKQIGIILLSVIGLVSIGVAYGLNTSVQSQKRDYDNKYSEKHFYTMADNFVGENELEVTSDSIDLLKKVNNVFVHSKEFDYYMAYAQHIYIEKTDVNPAVLYGYEYGADIDDSAIELKDSETGKVTSYLQVKAFWLDENYIKDYGIRLSEGELFNKNDYDEITSVILGSAYKDKFNVGDKINIDFFYFSGEVIVKGFVEEGTNIYYDSEFISLNNYIIVPMPNGTEMENSWKTLYFMYMKNSGMVVSDKTEKDIQQIINRYEEELGIGNWYYIKEYGDTEVNTMTISLNRVANVVKGIACLVIVTIIIVMVIYYWKTLNLSKPYFSVLILNGCTYKSIRKIMMSESIINMVIGYVLGLAGVWFVNYSFNIHVDKFLFIWLFLAIFVYEFVPLVCMLIIFFRKDLAEYLKEEIVE